MFCATLVSGRVGMQTSSQCKHKFDVHKEIAKRFIGIKQFNPNLMEFALNGFNLGFNLHINTDQRTYTEHIKYSKRKREHSCFTRILIGSCEYSCVTLKTKPHWFLHVKYVRFWVNGL